MSRIIDTAFATRRARVSGRLADSIRLTNGLSGAASSLLPRLRGCYLVEDEEAAVGDRQEALGAEGVSADEDLSRAQLDRAASP